MLNKSIEIVYISNHYIKYLYNIDNKVMYNKGQRRPYIGILFEVQGNKYYAPLTHPKEKFKTMPNNIDFHKLDNGKLGAINFNNMIPVHDSAVIHIEINKIEDIKYKFLILKQIEYLNKNHINIIDKANRLYNYYINKTLKENVYNRCCNFTKLEEVSKLYKPKTI